MAAAPRPKLTDFQEPPRAPELQRAASNRGFTPELEREYLRAHLRQNRALIRPACALALLLALSRAVERIVIGSPGALLLTDLALVLSSSIVLAALAWGPAFERHYLPWAQVIVPVRNVIAAAHLAAAAAHGQLELLMVLPLMLIGPFSFMGLPFRTALVSGVLTTASFIACSALFELALPVALRSDLFLLVGLVGCAIAARQVEQASRERFLDGHAMAELAQRDALTGTMNRRVFDEHLASVWQQAAASRRALAILLMDVDHFKAYNDRYGHLAGDETLRRVAGTLQHFVRRPLDILSRYGGEEFAAVLYDVSASQAQEIAEKIRRAVAELAIEHHESRTLKTVTISIGVAFVQPTLERNGRGALQLADQALYEAKVSGRNRVELMDEMEYRLLVTGVFPNSVAGLPGAGDHRTSSGGAHDSLPAFTP